MAESEPIGSDGLKRFWNASAELIPESGMRRIQLEKLQRMLQYVYHRSPFYRDKLDRAGVRPDRIRSLEEFSASVPLTTKEELRLMQSSGYPLGSNTCVEPEKIVHVCASTGTTGKPTYTCATQRDWDAWMEAACRMLWIGGLRPGQVHVHGFALSTWISGVTFVTAARMLGATVVPVGVPTPAPRMAMFLKDLRAQAMACTPSYAEHLGLRIPEVLGMPVRELSVRKLMCGGEPGAGIPAVRDRLQELWNSDVRDIYGTPEMIPGDWVECEFKNGMHFTAREFCYNELVDPATSDPVAPGEGVEAALVYTALDKQAGPLIRFAVSDVVRVFTDPCACGYPGMRLTVVGRNDDMLKVKGVKTWPSAVKDIINQMAPRLTGEFRIVLSQPPVMFAVAGPLRLKAEYHGQPDERGLNALRNELSERIRTSLLWAPDEIELVPAGSLPKAEFKARYVEIEPHN